MIKTDEGKLVLKGDYETLMAEFTIIAKTIFNEFGMENFAKAIVLALTAENNGTRVDMTSFNEMMKKLKEEGGIK